MFGPRAYKFDSCIRYMTNKIPVSQLQIGDEILYQRGNIERTNFYKLERIKDMMNGTKRLFLGGSRVLDVLSKGEVTVKV